jgi:uncharacterized phiE125 gp8 family phage protein
MIKQPEAKVVSLEEVKTHLRLDHDYEDSYLEVIIDAATNFIENYIGRSLICRTYKSVTFRENAKTLLQSIALFMPPLIEIVEVNRVITEKHKVSIKRFCVNANDAIPHLECSADYPTVEIIYKTGYGQNACDVPQDIRHAILLQIAEFYEKRENIEGVPASLIQNILQPYRVLRMV